MDPVYAEPVDPVTLMGRRRGHGGIPEFCAKAPTGLFAFDLECDKVACKGNETLASSARPGKARAKHHTGRL